MKDQHKLIRGYRDLDPEEIDLMNRIKTQGEELKKLIDELYGKTGVDIQWIHVGKIHLQQGIMALVRSVARPESF